MELTSGDRQSGIEVMKSERGQRPLSPAAQRALAEAEARRKSQKAEQAAPEVGGRDGPDPARYGDWEKGGIVSDF
jgi:hypothetical protein